MGSRDGHISFSSVGLAWGHVGCLVFSRYRKQPLAALAEQLKVELSDADRARAIEVLIGRLDMLELTGLGYPADFPVKVPPTLPMLLPQLLPIFLPQLLP